MLLCVHPSRDEALSLDYPNRRLIRWRLGERAERIGQIELGQSQPIFLERPDAGGSFLIAFADARVERRSWDAPDAAEVLVPSRRNQAVEALDQPDDGSVVAIAEMEALHLVGRAGTRTSLSHEVYLRGDIVADLAFDPTGGLLAVAATGQGGGAIRLLSRGPHGFAVKFGELPHRDTVTPMEEFHDAVAQLAFSPDGRSLCVFESSWEFDWVFDFQAWRGNLLLWDTESGARRFCTVIEESLTGDLRTMEEVGFQNGYPSTPVFTRDGALVAVGVSAGQVLFFDAATGRLAGKRDVAGPEDNVCAVARGHEANRLWAWVESGQVVPVVRP